MVVVAMGVVAAAPPASAQLSSIAVSVVPVFSSPVTVGAQDQPASLVMMNQSFGSVAGTQPVQIANIRLNASCNAATGGEMLCPLPEARAYPALPILSIDSQAVGRAGTACAGTFFAVSAPDAAETVQLVPSSPVALGPATAGGPAATCIVDLTFDVRQRPLDGQTSVHASVNAQVQGLGQTTATGTSSVTVLQATPSLQVQVAAATVAEGTPINATAVVSGVPGGPPVTGTAEFRLFSTSTNCGSAPVASASPVALVPGPPGGVANSSASVSLPAPPPGAYSLVAGYSGDVNYTIAGSPCNAPAAQVNVLGTPPTIQVSYTPSPVSRPAPGGAFTYAVTVTNTSAAESVTVTSVNDNVFGNLATRPGSTCGALIGAVLAPGASPATCMFTADFTGPGGSSLTSVVTVTAVDNDGQSASDEDDATVTISGLVPTVQVTKTANPTSRPAPGGDFTFTVVITNTGGTPVTITSITDNIYGDLATRPGSTCGALIGTVLAPSGAAAPCTFVGIFTGPPGTSQTDVVVVTVVDSTGTPATDSDDATVTITGEPGLARYVPLSPARIEDTRTGAGGLSGPVGPGATVAVQVTGRGGVPAGASAVVLNVTVTQPTAEGYLTLYPDGAPRPLAANVNFTPGKTVPNLVVVKVGAGGRVAMFNATGATHVIYDVAGYFSESVPGNAGRYQPLVPARIADTRLGVGGLRLGPGQSIDVQVTGRGGAPAAGVSAAVLNVAATGTTAESYLTVYPTGEPRPLAANLNFVAGDTVSNRTMTKLGAGGRVTIYNNAGSTDVVVDVGGTFTDAGAPGIQGDYHPVDPARILDTRGPLGLGGAVPAGGTLDIQVAGQAGVPASGVRAVILNVAVTQPAAAGYFTMFPSGAARPLASDLNYAAGETRANLVVVQVGENGKVSLFSSSQAHVVVDVAGWFS